MFPGIPWAGMKLLQLKKRANKQAHMAQWLHSFKTMVFANKS